MALARQLRLTQSNAVGFVSIVPQDPLSLEINDDDPLSDDYVEWHIPSIYESTTYSIELTVNVDYLDTSPLPPLPPTFIGTLPVRSISTSYDFANNGMTANILSSNSVRLSGTFVNAFLDQYYEFVLEDNSLVQMAPNVNSTFKALVEYEMPDNTLIDFGFPFEFTVNTEFSSAVTTADSKDVGQWVVWEFNTAANIIAQLIASRPNA